MPLELSEQQRLALPALEWLFDPSEINRRTGRTMVMAIAAMRSAVRWPGTWIRLIDHTGEKRMADSMLNYIFAVAHNIGFPNEGGLETRRSAPSFRIAPNYIIPRDVYIHLFSATELEEGVVSNFSSIYEPIPRDYAGEVLPSIQVSLWDHLTSEP